MSTLPTSPRYLELDAMRGFAVMGILLMNIVGFAMPDMAYFSPAVYGGTDTPDIIIWALSFIFVDGKMRGLFTLLFGASTMLVISGAEAKGLNSAKIHYSRMFWLAVFGLAHFFFLWFGDILFLYAVIGCIIYLMKDMASEKLMRYALLLYIAGFIANSAMMGSLLFLQYQAGLPGASASLIAKYQETIAGFEGNIQEQLSLYSSSFLAILQAKLSDSLFDPLTSIGFKITETLPLMMIGMALYKNGFFTGGWEAAQYRKWAMTMIPIGITLLIPITIYLIMVDFELLRVLNANLAWTAPAILIMTIGYAALLILAIQKYARYELMHRIAGAGRAAFTNYLGTTILMTFIFYGWGLGLYGSVSRAGLYLFVPSAWILMILWSKPWLMRFRYGPLEWLWRSLSRIEPQPMRISR